MTLLVWRKQLDASEKKFHFEGETVHEEIATQNTEGINICMPSFYCRQVQWRELPFSLHNRKCLFVFQICGHLGCTKDDTGESRERIAHFSVHHQA